MIDLNLSIRNPWAKSRWTPIFVRYGKLTKNKFWEVEFVRYSMALFEFRFAWTCRCDHAGVSFNLGIFGYIMQGYVRDSRHWDTFWDRWNTY